MWSNYTPHPYLKNICEKLAVQSFDPRDPRTLFFELEEKGVTNVEKFMEFVWENRNAKFSVSEAPPAGYISGLYAGTQKRAVLSRSATRDILGQPAVPWYSGPRSRSNLVQCFHENGVGFRSLELTKSVAAKYGRGDLVLNLITIPVFEIASKPAWSAVRCMPQTYQRRTNWLCASLTGR